ARYRDQIGATPMGQATMTEVSGLPAGTQEGGLASYDYVGYWLFSSDQLLHVYCQWTSDAYRATITSRGDEPLASAPVPDACGRAGRPRAGRRPGRRTGIRPDGVDVGPRHGLDTHRDPLVAARVRRRRRQGRGAAARGPRPDDGDVGDAARLRGLDVLRR